MCIFEIYHFFLTIIDKTTAKNLVTKSDIQKTFFFPVSTMGSFYAAMELKAVQQA